MRFSSPYIAAGVASLLLFCMPMLSHAQATAVDQISGTIQDSTGAAISQAQITAHQTSTGFTRSTVSGSDGSYLLRSLPIGPYRIEVSAPGFKTYRREGIVLQVNVNPQMNAVLEVGLVSQQVEVRANIQMAETQTTGISQIIDERQVVDLPLNGRQPTQLVLLAGAAVTAPPSDLASSKNYPSSTTIAIAGGQANGTYYLLDGGDHNDAFGSINLPIPFPDLLQEFSVQTNSIPASYGERAGGVVNIVTKSGTNAFHGDLFEFLRNGAVNAKNYFASSVDQLKRNQFGGTLGGPILRDRLFFFGGYQGTITHTAPPTTTSFVPTAQALQGNFSTQSSACAIRTITDPQTGKPFPNNQIPVGRFNPQALNLLKYIPTTTDPCGKILYSIPNNSTENQYLGRIDWTQSARHSLFGRYYFTNSDNPAVFTNNNLLLTSRPGTKDTVQSFVVGDSYTLNAAAINAFHFTWSRERINRGPASGLPTADSLGLNVAPSPGNSPQISVSSHFNTSCGICSLAKVYSGSKQFADDINIVKGRHQFAFGGEWINRYVNYQTSTQQNVSYSFNGQLTGDAVADFLLGLPSSFIQGNLTILNYIQNYVGIYASDKIRVSPRLSINAGLRWEPYFPERETKQRVTHFDLPSFIAGTKSAVFQNAPPGLTFPGDKDFPRGGTYSHLSNFAPRLGVVWDTRGNAETVVRAGYGVLYDLPAMQYFDRFGFGPPWASAITLNNPAGGFTDPYLTYPGGDPFPLPIPPKSDATFALAGQYANLPLHIHPSYFQQWNLSLQQQFSSDWLFSLNYLGNKGTHLWAVTEGNPAVYIPGQCGAGPCSTVANTNSRRVLSRINSKAGSAFSSLATVDDGANSSYNAMLVTLNHRLRKHFSLLMNYTWSHCINEGGVQSELSGNAYQDPNNRASNRGNCITDVRQIFNASLVAGTPHFTKNFALRFIGDWELSTIVTARSGFWFSPSTGSDASLTGVGSDRPNVIGNPNDVSSRSLNKWFNTAAFNKNQPGTYGNAGRDSLVGPGGYHVDMALFRSFPFVVFEKPQSLQFRVEAFNAFNHPIFDNPSSNFSSSNFGRILGASDPRIMQVALKYIF